jgi:hypothetical protein
MKIIISESEKKHIKSLYSVNEIDAEKIVSSLFANAQKIAKDLESGSIDSDVEKENDDESSNTIDTSSRSGNVIKNKLDIKNKFKVDIENGPKNHKSRALGNWESDNAWDMFAPAGTVVNSFTKGFVRYIKDYGQDSGKIYGTGVIISGIDGYPDIFYTHIKNVKLKSGDKVDVGSYIGEISEWKGHDPSGEHVHVGLPFGKHIRDYIA